MNGEGKSAGKGLGYALMALEAVVFAATLVATVLAIRDLGEQYRAAFAVEPVEGAVVQLGYDDHLYAVIGKGMSFAGNDADPQRTLTTFLDDTLNTITMRVLTAGLLYSTAASVLMALFFANLRPARRTLSGRFTPIAGLAAYVIFIVVAVAAFILCGIPLSALQGLGFAPLVIGIMSAAAGNMVVGLLVGCAHRKAPMAIVCVPVAIVLFLAGIVTETFALSEPTVDSFDYVAQIDSRILEEGFDGAYYDSERNVLVVDGTEFEPEQLPNPDHATGAALAGCIAFELLNPYSGCSLGFVREFLDISWPIMLAYLLRTCGVLLILSKVVMRKIDARDHETAEHAPRHRG